MGNGRAARLITALSAAFNGLTGLALDVAAVGVLAGWIGPLAPLGKWASLVLLVGASAACGVLCRAQVEALEVGRA